LVRRGINLSGMFKSGFIVDSCHLLLLGFLS